MARSDEIIRELRRQGHSDTELAHRTGLARETLSRWASATQQPTLQDLQRVVAAAGAQLDIRLIPADRKLIELARDQLELSPAVRVKVLLGRDWAACRDALGIAAHATDLALLVGPVAASLRGAPQRPGHGHVDLLVTEQDRYALGDCLLDVGAHPNGVERAADASELRERWRAGRGRLTVRWNARGISDVVAVRLRGRLLAIDQQATVRVARVEDLLTISEYSPWSEDAVYREGLRAVLASGRYSTREKRHSA